MSILLNHNTEHWIEECPEYGIKFRDDLRYFVQYGGRGGGKSHDDAEKVITLMRFRANYRVLCVREFQNSLDDSVYSLMEQKAQSMYPNFFEFKNGKIYGANGSFASFKGLARNLGSVKSLEGYDMCWIEEGQYISAAAWELLNPTIRKENSKILITMNRESETSVLDKMFIQDTPPPRSDVVKVNYYDNPYPIPELEEMAEHCKRVDYEAYRYIWLGELNMISKAQVLHGKWRVENFDTAALIEGKSVPLYHGADWSNGGADPHTLIRSFILDNKLYIDYEMMSNLDFQQLPELWNRFPSIEASVNNRNRLWTVYCDGARPDLVKMMFDKGYNAKAAPKKWRGDKSSVRAGIDYLRSFDEIIIHDRCKKTAEEAANWKWKIDERSGDVMPELVDAHNHLMDALRYSHYPMISNVRKRY